MSYQYEELKKTLHTDELQARLISASEELKTLLSITGAIRKGVILGRISGDSWTAMAIIDRIVELNPDWIVCKPFGEMTAWQHEVIYCRE